MLQEASRLRLRLLGIVALALFGSMFGRLWFVQVVEAEVHQEAATANVLRVVTIEAPRGRIFDVNGTVIVDNRVSSVLVVDRQELRNADLEPEERQAMFTRLAREINRAGGLIKASLLLNSFENVSYGNLEQVPVAWDVDDGLLVFVGERSDEFPGISVQQRLVRTYPYGPLAAHLLGYTGSVTSGELEKINDFWRAAEQSNPKPYEGRDSIGKTGIELLFEDHLRGVPGERVYEVDKSENVVRELLDRHRDPIPGNDVYLTIDVAVQSHVESELEQALIEARTQTPEPGEPAFDAPAGSVVMTDPSNGQVLAMASYPTYNPADLVDGVSGEEWADLTDPVNNSPILNRSIQSTYAPGSTFKPITAYAALTEGVFGSSPSLPSAAAFIPDPGFFELKPCEGDKCIFYNAGRKPIDGGVDLTFSITQSSDTYYYRLGEAFVRSSVFSDTAIQDTAALFGFGRTTGVELPNERAGLLPTAELKQQRHLDNPEAFPFGDWFIGDNLNVAIGQGDVGVTPIQLANAYATFANGGRLHQNTLVSKITDHQGAVIQEFGPRVVGQIDMAPEHREPLAEGLWGVIGHPLGTAYDAFNRPESGGIDYGHEFLALAGKTGTAEVNDKADSSIFAAFGPVYSPTYSPPGGPEPEPRYAIAAILEEAGFGSRVAAPLVARIMDPIARGTLEAPKTQEVLREEFLRSLLEPCETLTEDAADGASTDGVPADCAPSDKEGSG